MTAPALCASSRPATAETPSPQADADLRATRTPLTPSHVGDSIGEDPDPEQDVAANLGGESQMQDA